MSARGEARREQILAFIAQFVQRHGYPPSLREIGRGVGIRSVGTVARHLAILEAAGRLSHVPSRRRSWQLSRPPAGAWTALPLIGRIPAGTPILAQSDVEDYWPLPVGLFHPPADFLLRVRGDSMIEAGIWDGDVVAVHAQSHAESGQIIIARLGDEATVKRLELPPAGPPRLVPANSRYPTIEAPELVVLGLVVGLIRGFPPSGLGPSR
ncbi:MAG: transcriptional repressor LexA [Firmicutes bacterium]|nr:transcriptional repressor LexA [Alicyclobacillaceae bacterium]MCL6496887.1 transcriptional repressor LexA [Bacillota bacterium]